MCNQVGMWVLALLLPSIPLIWQVAPLDLGAPIQGLKHAMMLVYKAMRAHNLVSLKRRFQHLLPAEGKQPPGQQ